MKKILILLPFLFFTVLLQAQIENIQIGVGEKLNVAFPKIKIAIDTINLHSLRLNGKANSVHLQGQSTINNLSDTLRTYYTKTQTNSRLNAKVGTSDVSTVVQGGSGRATGTTPYSLIVTGTTPTGAQQTVSMGNAGDVIVSGGAGALPTAVTPVAASGILVMKADSGVYDGGYMTPYASTPLTYYVSNNGSDAANGLTPSTAWQTISKVNATTLVSGNTVCFKRGDEWREQLTIDESGTATKKITFTAYGNGAKPIINGADIITGWGDSYNNINRNIWGTVSPNATTTRCMVVIADSLYTQVATLAEVTSARKYWIKTASTPDSIYVWSKTDPDSRTTEISKRDYGISSSKIHISISHLDIRMAGSKGIILYGYGSNVSGYSYIEYCNLYRNRLTGVGINDGYGDVIIDNCTASYNGNGFVIWGMGGGGNNCIIKNCTSSYSIHDYIMEDSHSDGTAFQLFDCDSSVIENCVSTNDDLGIFLDPNSSQNLTMTARYNKVSGANRVANESLGIGTGPSGTGCVINIYYNLLVNNGNNEYSSMIFTNTNSGVTNIYNNTVYNDTNNPFTAALVLAIVGTNLNFKNNVFYYSQTTQTNTWIIYFLGGVGLPTNDYNQFYKVNDVIGPVAYNYTSYTTLAAWAAASSQDGNSDDADPAFMASTTFNLALKESSPCIDAGVVISTIPQVDMLGHPIIGLPDMGCIEKY